MVVRYGFILVVFFLLQTRRMFIKINFQVPSVQALYCIYSLHFQGVKKAVSSHAVRKPLKCFIDHWVSWFVSQLFHEPYFSSITITVCENANVNAVDRCSRIITLSHKNNLEYLYQRIVWYALNWALEVKL